MLEFTLLTPVWLPLLLGTLWIGSAMVRGLQVTQVARDLASMFCRAVDFSATGAGTASNDILPKLSQELGTVTSTGTGVVIFSTLTYVGNSVCAMAGPAYHDNSTPPQHTAACTNYGKFVFTQRYTVGNRSLRSSSFGAPATADLDSTKQYNIHHRQLRDTHGGRGHLQPAAESAGKYPEHGRLPIRPAGISGGGVFFRHGASGIHPGRQLCICDILIRSMPGRD